MDHTDKVVTLIEECSNLKLKVLSPHVNESRYEFTVSDARTIRYGLGAIKGVGQGAVDALIVEREARGPYQNLEDLCRRMDLQKINRRTLEALIRSGSLDGLGTNRATLMNRLPAAMQLGEQNSKDSEAGQVDFFGLATAEPRAPSPVAAAIVEQPDWSEAVRLAGERETLGLYLTGHPINRFESDLPRFGAARIADLLSEKPMETGRGFSIGRPAKVAGLIHEVRKRGARTSIVLDDRSGRLECTLFDDIFQQHRDLIAKDALVLVEGKLRFDEFIDSWRLSAQIIRELDKVREQNARRLVLKWPARGDGGQAISRLAELLTPWRGGQCQVTVEYAAGSAVGALNLGSEWSVRPSRELLEHLEGLVGREGYQLRYGPPPGVGHGPSFASGG
jgi:DNA polymerase-3 subunit alpha